MKLDYIELENEIIEIKSNNNDGDSNYYTLLIGENSVGKTYIFETIISKYLNKNIEEKNDFKKIIFSAYTLFNRTGKYSKDESGKVYISNFNSNNIIRQVSNLYIENVWLSKNFLFEDTLNEVYRILEIDNQVSVDLSSITTVGYTELFNKINNENINFEINDLINQRERLCEFNIESLLEIFAKDRSGFNHSQLNEKIKIHFINNKKIAKMPKNKKRIYEIILIFKSILIDAGYKKRGTGSKSTYFLLEEIINIYHYYLKLEKDDIIEVLKIDFQIFNILELNFANNLLLADKYEKSKVKQLDELSSGEFAMITRFMELAGEVENNSLVLIDEPETFLNPKWINEFIYLLKTLFKNMGCHFIIASQSPFIIGNLNKEDIIKIIKEKNEIIYKYEEEETFGMDYNSIIKEIFKMDLIDSKLIKNYLSEIEDKSVDNILESIRMISRLGNSKEKIKLVRRIASPKNKEEIKKEILDIERKYFNE